MIGRRAARRLARGLLAFWLAAVCATGAAADAPRLAVIVLPAGIDALGADDPLAIAAHHRLVKALAERLPAAEVIDGEPLFEAFTETDRPDERAILQTYSALPKDAAPLLMDLSIIVSVSRFSFGPRSTVRVRADTKVRNRELFFVETDRSRRTLDDIDCDPQDAACTQPIVAQVLNEAMDKVAASLGPRLTTALGLR